MGVAFKTILIITAAVLAGCNPTRDSLVKFDSYVEQGQIELAASFSASNVKQSPNPSNNDVIWLLQAASSYSFLKQYELSNEYYHQAEDFIKYFNEREDKNVRNAWSVITSDTSLAYEGTVYDGIMVNTYKAINSMFIGDFDAARIEFNRAIDRQRRAKEFFSTDIDNLRQEIQQNNEVAYQNATNSKNMELLDLHYPELRNFEPYADFINPFTSYIAGLFFYLDGDFSKAEFLIRQAAGMTPDNTYIVKDMENILARKATGDTVWVIFENGLAPVKDEFRIDLPLFIATNKVQYFGVALPKIRTRTAAAPYLVICDGVNNHSTLEVADMERVIKTEFEKKYPEILVRAIASATLKAAAQYALQENSNSTAALLMAMYSYASTVADCRIWSNLPKNFQVARLPKPSSGKMLITPASNEYYGGFEVDLAGANNAIVYVKMIPAAEPVYEIIRF